MTPFTEKEEIAFINKYLPRTRQELASLVNDIDRMNVAIGEIQKLAKHVRGRRSKEFNLDVPGRYSLYLADTVRKDIRAAFEKIAEQRRLFLRYVSEKVTDFEKIDIVLNVVMIDTHQCANNIRHFSGTLRSACTVGQKPIMALTGYLNSVEALRTEADDWLSKICLCLNWVVSDIVKTKWVPTA